MASESISDRIARLRAEATQDESVSDRITRLRGALRTSDFAGNEPDLSPSQATMHLTEDQAIARNRQRAVAADNSDTQPVSMSQRPTGWDKQKEQDFQNWYAPIAQANNLDPNPDDPAHHYNYRMAFAAGASPGSDGHWPSQYKDSSHPNRYVDGEDTITGKPTSQFSPDTVLAPVPTREQRDQAQRQRAALAPDTTGNAAVGAGNTAGFAGRQAATLAAGFGQGLEAADASQKLLLGVDNNLASTVGTPQDRAAMQAVAGRANPVSQAVGGFAGSLPTMAVDPVQLLAGLTVHAPVAKVLSAAEPLIASVAEQAGPRAARMLKGAIGGNAGLGSFSAVATAAKADWSKPDEAIQQVIGAAKSGSLLGTGLGIVGGALAPHVEEAPKSDVPNQPAPVEPALQETVREEVRKQEGQVQEPQVQEAPAVGQSQDGQQGSLPLKTEHLEGTEPLESQNLVPPPAEKSGAELPKEPELTPESTPVEARAPEPGVGATFHSGPVSPEVIDNATANVGEAVKGAVDVGSRIRKKAADFIAGTSEAGKQLGSDLYTIEGETAHHANTDTNDLKAVLKGVSEADRIEAAKVVDGYRDGQQIPTKIQELADQIREVNDRARTEAQGTGIQALVGGEKQDITFSGRAIPQVPTEEFRKMATAAGKSEGRKQAFIDRMVSAGKTEKEALNLLFHYGEARNRSIVGNLERERPADLPEQYREWDPLKIMPGSYYRNWRLVESSRLWGSDPHGQQPGRNALLEQMKIQGVDPALVEKIKNYLDVGFGAKRPETVAGTKAANMVGNFETLMKLGFSPIRGLGNLFQRYTNTADLPLASHVRATIEYPPFINKFFKASRDLQDRMERLGAVTGHSEAGHLNPGPGTRLMRASLAMQSATEIGNQVYTARVYELSLDHSLKKLVAAQGEQSPLRAAFDAVSSIGDTNARRVGEVKLTDERAKEVLSGKGGFKPEEIRAAVNRAVLDRQFALNLATSRMWYQNPWARLIGKFKPFGLDQIAFIHDRVVKEAYAHGNFAPLIKFTVATLLAGEIVSQASDLLSNKHDQATRTLGERVLHDFANGGGLGMVSSLTFGIKSYLEGPVAGTARNLGAMAYQAIEMPEQAGTAIREFFRKESVAVRQVGPVWERIKSLTNRTADEIHGYDDTRSRAFAFRDQVQNPGIKDQALKVVKDALGQSNDPQNLSMQYAAKSIAVGDQKSAVFYLSRLVRQAGDDKDRQKKMVQSLEQWPENSSPLGPVPNEKLADYKATRTPEEWKAESEAQRVYLRGANAAVVEAIRQNRKQPAK